MLWDITRNPWVILQTVSRAKLQSMFAEPAFRKAVDDLVRVRREDAEAPAWFQQTHAGSPLSCVAYFSMEFMLSEALPIYSGGLGNVAGDQLKAVCMATSAGSCSDRSYRQPLLSPWPAYGRRWSYVRLALPPSANVARAAGSLSGPRRRRLRLPQRGPGDPFTNRLHAARDTVLRRRCGPVGSSAHPVATLIVSWLSHTATGRGVAPTHCQFRHGRA